MAQALPPIPLQCVGCKQMNATIVETMALCPVCRARFKTLNLPNWLKYASVALILVVLFNLVRIPSMVSALIASESHKSAMEVHDHSAKIFLERDP